MKKNNINFKTIVVSITTLITICALLIIYPSTSKEIIDKIFDFCTIKFGFIYIWVFIASSIGCGWLAFGKYRNIKLGEGEPEFSVFSWCSMMFAAGMASGLVYWSSIEWVYYYSDPAFGIEPFSWLAAEYAGAYPLFHWGILPYCMYFLPAVALSIMFYNRKVESFSFGEACRPVFGNRVNGMLGEFINILFIIGLLGGISTSFK